jgi:hypothetical protein
MKPTPFLVKINLKFLPWTNGVQNICNFFKNYHKKAQRKKFAQKAKIRPIWSPWLTPIKLIDKHVGIKAYQ